MPGFFDPGHGLLSSVDERAIAIAAFVVFAIVGAAAEYLGDAKGFSVAGALLGFVVAVLLLAPAPFASEWHYAVMVAIPVVLLTYLYRRRGE